MKENRKTCFTISGVRCTPDFGTECIVLHVVCIHSVSVSPLEGQIYCVDWEILLRPHLVGKKMSKKKYINFWEEDSKVKQDNTISMNVKVTKLSECSCERFAHALWKAMI